MTVTVSGCVAIPGDDKIIENRLVSTKRYLLTCLFASMNFAVSVLPLLMGKIIENRPVGSKRYLPACLFASMNFAVSGWPFLMASSVGVIP